MKTFLSTSSCLTRNVLYSSSSIRKGRFSPFIRCFASSSSPTSYHLRIIFGSQSGTAEAFANDLEFDAQEHNISTELIDALKFTPSDLKKLESPDHSKRYLNAFIMACYGEGEPTDNAKKFFQAFDQITLNNTNKTNKNEFANVKYSVFGLGNSQCFRDRYNVIGKKLDKTLETYGGKRFLPLGLGDASPEKVGSDSMGECFITWKKQLFEAIKSLPNPTTETLSTPATTETTTTPAKPSTTENTTSAPAEMQQSLEATEKSDKVCDFYFTVPIALSARQRAMIPHDRIILKSTVSHVTQLFARTDEMTAAVEVEFDLTKTKALFSAGSEGNPNYTQGLQPGDHIGVFAPNSKHVVERFALAAGLSEDLDKPIPSASPDEEVTTLRQILTWQNHLSGVASVTSIKLLQRWLKEQPNYTVTAQLFSKLETSYDTLVRDKGHDTAAILDMIPKIPGVNNTSPAKLPIAALLKTLPTLNPRLYSITHMVLPSDRAIASAAAAHACPIAQALKSSIHTPTAADDYTKITLLCRLLRYRQTKSSVNRIVDGVCSSYLAERLIPEQSEVAIFFRESNFHLPAPIPASSAANPSPVIMIGGGSGLAPFMSFLEERQRLIEKPEVKIGPAVLYFGCRTNEEYIFRDRLVSYLGEATHADSNKITKTLDRLMVSFSTHQEGTAVSSTESLHPHEILNPKEQHIPEVVKLDKEYLLPLIQQGGVIYVCGGAGQFGKAVREVVNELAMDAFGIHPSRDETGKEVIHPGIRHLIQSKKYFEDLAD